MIQRERVTQRQPFQSPPPQLAPFKLTGFRRDLYFCLDIALRRLKDLYSWKLPLEFLS